MGTVFVGLSDELLNLRNRKTVDLHCFLQTKIFGCVDKDTDNTGNICKDMVGAASDDNAGAFFCELADDFCLIAKKVVILCKTCAFRGKRGGIFEAAGKERTQRAVLFFLILEQSGMNAAFFGSERNNLPVVAGNIQTLCQHFADGTSAAAILTGDGNYCV